ncbi:YrhC family protein [Neobacillus sp. LXY-1]|uniref:YrhC family protein n=1 Tax=Neobacillus sp. LXY-1 TaxID=3379133 RepID=UPI003EDE9E67
MKQKVKSLYERMVDFKRFGIVLLVFGIFFYFGLIIPSDAKTEMDRDVLMIGSTSFMAASILFFTLSKQCYLKLLKSEEGQDYLSKK